VLYQIVQQHFETFRAQAVSQREGEVLPHFVEHACQTFLRPNQPGWDVDS